MALYKVAKLALNALIIGLLVTILVMLVRGQGSSGFDSGAPIVITPGPAAQKDPKSLFEIKPSLDCTPGPSEKADYYTMGLTPGGLCGGSVMVRDQMRDYAIAEGVGGSLLEK